MIIFAWKVNNPLSFLISPGRVKALNHFFGAIPAHLRVHSVYIASKEVFTKTCVVVHLTNKLSFVFYKVCTQPYHLTDEIIFYFWSSDGSTQALGTCLRDFRNKPYPIRAKIIYYKKTLTVKENKCTKMYVFVHQRNKKNTFYFVRSWSTTVSLQTRKIMSSAQRWTTWSFLRKASLAFQLPLAV